MSRSIPAFLAAVASAILLAACGENPASASEDLPLLRVYQTPLELTLGADLRCQVTMEVEVLMPNCRGFGHYEMTVEGHTYRYEFHATASHSARYCTGDSISYLGLCIGPGLDSPEPRLPPGDYLVVANGVSGSFVVR